MRDAAFVINQIVCKQLKGRLERFQNFFLRDPFAIKAGDDPYLSDMDDVITVFT